LMIAAAEESEVSTVRDSDIPVLVKRAWQTAITEAAVKRAFMECGTLPGHSDIIHALRESSQQVSIHNAYDFDGLSNVGGGRATSLLPEVDDYANSIWALHTVNQPGKTDLDRRNKGKRVHTDVGEMLTAEDALARRDAKEQSVEAEARRKDESKTNILNRQKSKWRKMVEDLRDQLVRSRRSRRARFLEMAGYPRR